jgi:hypothetical protein
MSPALVQIGPEASVDDGYAPAIESSPSRTDPSWAIPREATTGSIASAARLTLLLACLVLVPPAPQIEGPSPLEIAHQAGAAEDPGPGAAAAGEPGDRRRAASCPGLGRGHLDCASPALTARPVCAVGIESRPPPRARA